MRVLNDNVIIKPERSIQSDTGFESEYSISPSIGFVLNVGSDVKQVKVNDKVIFFTMTNFIEEEGWFVVPESDIKVVL